ncbi:tyrosine-type recombinase/integrase [Paraliobacillus ryukyuensis]|uniref:tyrosine-type recombinase/integrase n=1 Tax=Paraliobacillus ryukyuensis TaxID=200904 RepID=UPI00277B4D29|nr:tyrosine-type recombinase/integrase [Paraliobacillus ryukyuensis]
MMVISCQSPVYLTHFKASRYNKFTYSLRHTHSVILLEAENDMKFIQERLGHESYQITADIYSHISKRLDQKSMERYETRLGKINSSKSN